VLDRKWREHLYEMDYLQEGIGLRAMAQRDPLIEYQREGFQLFEAMMESIKEESVSHLFSVEVQVTPAQAPAGAVAPRAVSDMVSGLADAAVGDEYAAEADGEPVPAGVSLSGVDLRTDGDGERALSYSAPGEDGSVVRSGGQKPVERPANRRGKKVKRKRR
jgi:preprotein translocase subunit SecA